MTNRPIVPCIWFDAQAEEAALFYTKILPHGRITATSRYPDSGGNPSGKPPGSVLAVDFEVAGQRLTALNGGPLFTVNPSISFFVRVDTAAEAERLYSAFAENGEALMPLDSYPWSERYAWVKDRFGVSWQVIAGPIPEGGDVIVPCLMFAGPQHGKAEEALRTYSRIFPEGRVISVERYAKGEGPEGTVKHGRVMLAGQELIAMDSHLAHDISFNEGLSLQVMCADQVEVDRFWSVLAEGGSEGPCGWLKDRFGLSWQVVPARMVEWMTGGNAAARSRVFTAMMSMKKIDVAALEEAWQGR